MASDTNGKLVRVAQVSQAFTPAAPINEEHLFAERPDEAMRCLDALFQRGLHVILYGERGVGKTSLANVLPQLLRGSSLPDLHGLRIDCNTNDDYESIWRKVFRELGDELEDWPSRALEPEDVRHRLQRLDAYTLIVIDELDRVEDDEALTLLADTIKTLSDHSVEATLMLVGVARSVESLIGEHESIARSVTQVRMPRMSVSELEDILDRGFGMVDLTIEEDAQRHLVRLAEGLPHFVHLLGLYAGQRSVMDDRNIVTMVDVEKSIERAVDSHMSLSDYQKATQSPQKGHLFEQVLLACAFAPRSELGNFRAGDLREPLSLIMNREMGIPNFQRHLNEFSSDHRGPVLQREGVKRHYTYRFRNPLLQPYVKMRGLAKGFMDENLRERLQVIQGGTAYTESTLFDL